MADPTREELLAFLRHQLAEEQLADCYCEGDCPTCTMDVEAAAYWLAAHHHGGQSSNLYAALSASPYTPGACEQDLPRHEELPVASALYDAGARWLAGEIKLPLCRVCLRHGIDTPTTGTGVVHADSGVAGDVCEQAPLCGDCATEADPEALAANCAACGEGVADGA